MTKYYEMHSVQEAPVDYKTGRNSGTIFITMWNSLNQVGVKKAKEAFQKYQWPVIDVTRKSVEETAASIIKIYEIKNQNA